MDSPESIILNVTSAAKNEMRNIKKIWLDKSKILNLLARGIFFKNENYVF